MSRVGSHRSLLDGVEDEALTRAVARFYERMLSDDRVAHRFEHVNIPKLRAHQRSFLVAALGDPGMYNPLTLQHAHYGLRISDAEFDIALAHLRDSMVDAGVDRTTSDAIASRLRPLRDHIVVPAAD